MLGLKLIHVSKRGPWTQSERPFNTMRPRQNGRHFADDIFKCIFLNENVWISIKISLKFVPKGPIKYIPALVQIMAWRLPGDKPLSEPMMVRLPTHICVTRPQWVKVRLYYGTGVSRKVIHKTNLYLFSAYVGVVLLHMLEWYEEVWIRRVVVEKDFFLREGHIRWVLYPCSLLWHFIANLPIVLHHVMWMTEFLSLNDSYDSVKVVQVISTFSSLICPDTKRIDKLMCFLKCWLVTENKKNGFVNR